MKVFKADEIARRALDAVRRRNGDSYTDRFGNTIEMLPASGNLNGVHGGREGIYLYSLRSPSHFPVRFHLWARPDKKLMGMLGIDLGNKDNDPADLLNSNLPTTLNALLYILGRLRR